MGTERIVFLYGNDEFAITQRVGALAADNDPEGMNTTRLDTHSATQEQLNTAVNAMPFLAGKRVVILADPSARSSIPAERKKLLDHLLASPESTFIILHETLPPKDIEKHWLVKRIASKEISGQAFFLPRPKDMPGWIIQETVRQAGSIEPAAAARLAEMTGDNTRQASNEIAKLLAYANFTRPVTITDVEKVSVVSAQANIFALVDALANGEAGKAQALLHRALQEEDALALWGMIIRQFRLLIQAREVLDANGSLQVAVTSIPEAQYSVEKAYQQARRISMPVLERIHHRLLEMDEDAKTGGMPLDVALDAFVVGLAAKPAQT